MTAANCFILLSCLFVCLFLSKRQRFSKSAAVFLTDAEEDPVDVSGGEVQEEEGEVDDEQEEAQNHTHPLLEALT